VTQPPPGNAQLGHPRLVVPAYFHPAVRPDDWAWLAEHPAQVRLVIFNPASGPGSRRDDAWIPTLDRLRSASVDVVGYVDTSYGRRLQHDAIVELRQYLDWYQVAGVLFDQVAATRQRIGYYAALAGDARSMGARVVVFNHGVNPHEAYADHADVLGTFEGPWSAYRDTSLPRWARSRPADQFYHVVHSVPRRHIADAYLMAAERGAGFVYVTDRSGSNPYDQLPAAWADFGVRNSLG
jgi:Spherulation-specific family 4